MLKKIKAYKFFDQVRNEAKKVTWLKRKELVAPVLVVLVAVFLFAIISLVCDYMMHSLVVFLLGLGK